MSQNIPLGKCLKICCRANASDHFLLENCMIVCSRVRHIPMKMSTKLLILLLRYVAHLLHALGCDAQRSSVRAVASYDVQLIYLVQTR